MIVAPEVEEYLYALLPARSRVLAAMEAYARRHDVPIVGPAVGRLLYQQARLIGARRIFELGSAIGYSTAWWALAAGPGGEVFYTDSDPENARRATDYLRRLRLAGRVRIVVGDALAALRRTRGSFDVVFCDLDKPQYPEALRLGLPRLRRGGLFVADNVLWSGKVARPDASPATQAILEFNRLVYRSRRLFPVVVPLRDGVALCQKL